MIALMDVSVSYAEKPVFTGLSFRLPESGAVAVLGPSGSGKTTLLRLLAGLIQPKAGHVEGLDGLRVSMAFQEDRLLPWRTALENVLFVLPEGDAGREAHARAWLSRMELEDAMAQYPSALSGGMQRRVALARACAYGGDVLLLDEPFKGMDEALRARVAPKIRGAAPLVVIVTHDVTEAALLDAKRLQLDRCMAQ